jgi:arylsulfatase
MELTGITTYNSGAGNVAVKGTLTIGPAAREVFCYYRGTQLCAARLGAWKAHFITQPGYGAGKPEPHDPPLLFNLEADPGETYECGADHPDVIAEIKAAVEKHKATVKPVKNQLVETVAK